MNIKLLHDGSAMCGHGLETYSELLQSVGKLLPSAISCSICCSRPVGEGRLAGKGQQVADQLRTFLAGLQCILKPGERGVSFWQIVKRYVEFPVIEDKTVFTSSVIRELKWPSVSNLYELRPG